MRKLFVAPLLALVLLVPSWIGTAALADPPGDASGTFTQVFVSSTARQAGGNTFIEQTNEVTLTGTFEGTCVEQASVVFHQNGKSNGHSSVICDLIVDGQAGTVTFRTNSQGDGPSFVGHFVVIDATGGLEGLNASGDFEGALTPTGAAGTYDGQYHIH